MSKAEQIIPIISGALKESGVNPEIADSIIDTIENDAQFKKAKQKIADAIEQVIEGAAQQGPLIHMNWPYFNGLVDQINKERKLTQFLGVGLRGVLPFAEREVEYLYDVARRDSDDVVRQEANVASRVVTRAQAALNRLETTELKIKNVPDDAFDDDFEVTFDEEETDQ